MEIEYKGGNCIVITTKKSTLVVDPKIEAIHNKEIVVKNTTQLATQAVFGLSGQDSLFIESPGEYEVANASIKGIAAKAHRESTDAKNSTMYSIDMEDVRIAILGHISADLNDEQLEQLGVVDILVVPVGGFGYTLEPHEAVGLVKRIGPKVVIPTHYADEKSQYSITQGGIDSFLKDLGAPVEKVAKYKIKAATLPEVLTVIQLEQS